VTTTAKWVHENNSAFKMRNNVVIFIAIADKTDISV
jgi:hypothetical protein